MLSSGGCLASMSIMMQCPSGYYYTTTPQAKPATDAPATKGSKTTTTAGPTLPARCYPNVTHVAAPASYDYFETTAPPAANRDGLTDTVTPSGDTTAPLIVGAADTVSAPVANISSTSTPKTTSTTTIDPMCTTAAPPQKSKAKVTAAPPAAKPKPQNKPSKNNRKQLKNKNKKQKMMAPKRNNKAGPNQRQQRQRKPSAL